MKSSTLKQWGLTACLVLSAAAWAAPEPPQDVISMEKAQSLATAARAGKLGKGELEFEKDRWIYSFDVQGEDKKSYEVNLDAKTGKVLENQEEGESEEAKEKQVDAVAGSYKLLSSTALPGDGGWDFLSVEAGTRRLYITHADSVQVLDADTLQLLGTVKDVKRPHAALALPELGLGFISSGDPGSVVVFDLKTFEKTKEIKTSADCDVILYDPASGNIFTFNGDSGNASVIDPKTLSLVGTLVLGGEPEVAVADGKGLIYDNLASTDEVVVIDTKALKVLKRWKLQDGKSPTGIALDAEKGRLFVGCRNKTMVVLDTATGKAVQTLPIGDHIDSTGFDPKSSGAFNSCGEGMISVALPKGDGYENAEPIKTQAGARTMTIDPSTGKLYTVSAQMLPEDPKEKKEKGKRRGFVPGSFTVYMYGR